MCVYAADKRELFRVATRTNCTNKSLVSFHAFGWKNGLRSKVSFPKNTTPWPRQNLDPDRSIHSPARMSGSSLKELRHG